MLKSKQLKSFYYQAKVFYTVWAIGVVAVFYAWELQKQVAGSAGEFFAVVIQGIAYFLPIAFMFAHRRMKAMPGL